ncbi:hypothetical protein KO353_15105 [Elioraea tepida]|uniref:Uncharacterized protein n=1 Tax=Elioraea tepida TaxID=2843330 RepID=A0A975U1C4_9PROT|nr:hypothetical protein [Elioraea tepida]QXM24545.1 hypothetical protein KO353_15105 [Elioraea tepida]
MSSQHYLLVARDLPARARLAARVKAAGGLVLLVLPKPALVVELSDDAKDEIAAHPDVTHCGGVQITPRPIRRIRVSVDGTQMNA